MASRVISLREKTNGSSDDEAVQLSQTRRPEVGRFRLQVDRQTKSSFQDIEGALTAGKAIKKSYPILHVSVYDTLEGQNKPVDL